MKKDERQKTKDEKMSLRLAFYNAAAAATEFHLSSFFFCSALYAQNTWFPMLQITGRERIHLLCAVRGL